MKVNHDLILHSSDSYSPEAKKIMVAIRPENIIFSKESFVSSLRNQMKGTVKDVVQVGPTVWLEVTVSGTDFKGIITPSSSELLEIERGKRDICKF